LAAVERPSPPGDYDVVVVGSGPGGLQTAYFLSRLGVRHAVISRDEQPGGMFQRFPVYQRLISWTKPDAPAERGSRDYEWYDHNSLLADESELKGLVPPLMDRAFDLPSRPEMEAGLAAFAAGAGLDIRYGCEWEATRHDGERFVLETTDGEYRSRAVVFALGVTEPWRAEVPGLDRAPHYVDTLTPERYAGRDVFIVGKRNSGFELAQGLLPWARRIVLGSPRPVEIGALALSPLRLRYLSPYEEHVRGGPGTYVIDVMIERVEPHDGGFRLVLHGTTWEGTLELEVDDVIAATGFQTPLRDLPDLGLATVADGRIPALTPFWESVSLPGAFFAGNATQGAHGAGRHSPVASSSAVSGFRYNARVLAEHLAETFGSWSRPRPPVTEPVPYLLAELSRSPDLRIQKGYLCRKLSAGEDGYRDEGILPLTHFLDGEDGIAATIEVDAAGRMVPTVYVLRDGEVSEHALEPHPLHEYEGESYARELASLIA